MPPSRKSQPSTLLSAAAALLLGLVLRLVFLRLHPLWVGDTLIYGDLAENMLRHHIFGFSQQSLQPTLIRLPGYPLFLAACFLLFGHANYLAVVLVQIALDLFGCILLGLLAGRLFGPRAGVITLWLAALCPFTANYTAAALTETLSLFCVTLALYALERWSAHYRSGALALGWSTLIGLALALAVLVRPDQGLLAAAVVPAMLWLAATTPSRSLNRSLGERLAPAAIASLVVLLPLLLWGLRNYRVFHVIQPLAPRYANDPGETIDLSFQRWYRTWGIDFQSTYNVYWNYDGAPIDPATLPSRAFDTPAQQAETTALLDRYNLTQSETPTFDAAFERLAQARIAAHPLRYSVMLPAAREANMWLRPRTELLRLPMDWWHFAPHPAASTFALLYALLNAACLAAALLGLLRRGRTLCRTHAPLMIAMLGFVALRSALLLTLDNSEPRYTLECFPIVFLFAAASLLRTPPTSRAETPAQPFITLSSSTQ